MMQHDTDISSGQQSIRTQPLVGLFLCELFGGVVLAHFVFFSPDTSTYLAWSLNATFLVPFIAMWTIVFSIWLLDREILERAALIIITVAVAASVYSCLVIYGFHERRMPGVILPDRSLSIVLGIALGAVMLRMAFVAVSSLRISAVVRSALIVTSICVMIVGGYAAYVTPAMLSAGYNLKDLPRKNISGLTNTPGPGVEMRSLDGPAYTLGQDRGRVVLMNFWATWCGPCLLELPELQKLYERMDRDQTRLLAVNLDDDTTNVRRFVDSLQLTFPVLWGTREIAGDYGIQMIPTNLIIDGSGVIRTVKVGYSGEADIHEIEARIGELLQAKR